MGLHQFDDRAGRHPIQSDTFRLQFVLDLLHNNLPHPLLRILYCRDTLLHLQEVAEFRRKHFLLEIKAFLILQRYSTAAANFAGCTVASAM
jgi:hypothetical protein